MVKDLNRLEFEIQLQIGWFLSGSISLLLILKTGHCH